MSSSDPSPIAAWRDALQELWFELKDESRSPRYVIAAWADCKPSTAGAWRRGECTPDLGTANRLARNAAAEGYPHLATLSLDDGHRIASIDGDVPVTGSLVDNIRDLDDLQAALWEAADCGDAGAIREIAQKLHHEADEIAAEATTSFDTNGTAA